MLSGRFTPRTLAYTLAAASFFLLGAVVYRDDPDGNPGAFTRLDESGKIGLKHWRQQNCNACHMLYGFGGYLGPDLTHVVQRVDIDLFKQIIREGTGQMPPGLLDPHEAEAVYAFLSTMDKSGQGHLAPAAKAPEWDEVFSALDMTDSPGVKAFATYGCGQCHQPYRLGELGAPDISRTLERHTRLNADAAMRRGRGNMPSFASMPQTDMNAILDLINLLDRRRAEITRRWSKRSELPWFNYTRREDAP